MRFHVFGNLLHDCRNDRLDVMFRVKYLRDGVADYSGEEMSVSHGSGFKHVKSLGFGRMRRKKPCNITLKLRIDIT